MTFFHSLVFLHTLDLSFSVALASLVSNNVQNSSQFTVYISMQRNDAMGYAQIQRFAKFEYLFGTFTWYRNNCQECGFQVGSICMYA